MYAVGTLGETGLGGFDFSFGNILSRLPEVVSAAATGYVTGGGWGAVTSTGTAALVKPSSKNFWTQTLTGAGLGVGAGSVTGAALAVGGYQGDKGLVGNAVANWLAPPPLTAGPAPSAGPPLTQAPPLMPNMPRASVSSSPLAGIGMMAAAALPFMAATQPMQYPPGYMPGMAPGGYPGTSMAMYPGAPGGSPYYPSQAGLGGGVSPVLILGAVGLAILVAVLSNRSSKSASSKSRR